MADFEKEFKKVLLKEGGYSNDPDDAGGETYLGISRVNNPSLKMWNIIDDIKNKYGIKNINNRLKQIDEIVKEVKVIYKTKYWDTICLDEVKNQDISGIIFDAAVNMGVTSAIRIAEHVMGMTVTGKFSFELLTNLKKYGNNK